MEPVNPQSNSPLTANELRLLADNDRLNQQNFNKERKKFAQILSGVLIAAFITIAGSNLVTNSLVRKSSEDELNASNNRINGLQVNIQGLNVTGTKLSSDYLTAVASKNVLSDSIKGNDKLLQDCYTDNQAINGRNGILNSSNSDSRATITSLEAANAALSTRVYELTITKELTPLQIIGKIAAGLIGGNQDYIDYYNLLCFPPTETPTATSTTGFIPSWTPTQTQTPTSTPTQTPTSTPGSTEPPHNPTNTLEIPKTPTKSNPPTQIPPDTATPERTRTPLPPTATELPTVVPTPTKAAFPTQIPGTTRTAVPIVN